MTWNKARLLVLLVGAACLGILFVGSLDTAQAQQTDPFNLTPTPQHSVPTAPAYSRQQGVVNNAFRKYPKYPFTQPTSQTAVTPVLQTAPGVEIGQMAPNQGEIYARARLNRSQVWTQPRTAARTASPGR